MAVVGFLCTCALIVHVDHKPGVWYAETHVLFLAPTSKANPNSLVTESGSILAVAGVVGRIVEPHPPAAEVVSPKVTLVDEGIRHGWSVTLPDDGGQFADNFDQQLLQVQAVGPSAADVRSRINSLVRQINTTLDRLQSRANVPVIDWVTTSENPTTIQLQYLEGSRTRALAATVIIGAALTAGVELALRRRPRWRRPHQPPSDSAADLISSVHS